MRSARGVPPAQYLHSSYADLVLGGLVGIHVVLPTDDESASSEAATSAATPLSHRPASAASDSSATLLIEPLFAPARQLTWFAAVGVRVRGREVDVLYDADGARYGGAAGLAVWVDGRLAAHAPTPQRLAVAV